MPVIAKSDLYKEELLKFFYTQDILPTGRPTRHDLCLLVAGSDANTFITPSVVDYANYADVQNILEYDNAGASFIDGTVHSIWADDNYFFPLRVETTSLKIVGVGIKDQNGLPVISNFFDIPIEIFDEEFGLRFVSIVPGFKITVDTNKNGISIGQNHAYDKLMHISTSAVAGFIDPVRPTSWSIKLYDILGQEFTEITWPGYTTALKNIIFNYNSIVNEKFVTNNNIINLPTNTLNTNIDIKSIEIWNNDNNTLMIGSILNAPITLYPGNSLEFPVGFLKIVEN